MFVLLHNRYTTKVQLLHNKSTTITQQIKYSKMINKTELKKLRKRLKQTEGYRDKLHESTGFSLAYIDYVLNSNNERYNQKVIDDAFALLKTEDEKKAEQTQLLK